MKRVHSINFRWVPNTAHATFFLDRLIPLFNSAGSTVKAVIAMLLAMLIDWGAKEQKCLAWGRRSAYTAQISEADHALDRAFAALVAFVRAMLYSTSPDITAAAHRVNTMLRNLGKVTTESYASELGKIKAALDNLAGTLAADVQTLGIAEQVSNLQEAYTSFSAIFNSRSEELAQKPELSFREVRMGIESVYHHIIALLEANLAAGTSPEYAELVAKLNPIIDNMNAQYARGHKAAAAPAEPAPAENAAAPEN